MTQHRARRPYSPAYARRQLVRVEQSLASIRALQVGADWRKSAAKAETLHRLEAEERKWRRILAPPAPERFYTLPF